jgi:hypothetical protein
MNAPQQPPPAQIVAGLTAEMVQSNTVTMNVAQNTLVITEDRLELCLIKSVPHVHVKDCWIAPLLTTVTLAATLATAQFRDLLFSAATWQAVFVLALLGSIAWTVHSVGRALHAIDVKVVLDRLRSAGTSRLVATAPTVPASTDVDTVGTSTKGGLALLPSANLNQLQCRGCGTLLPLSTAPQICPHCHTLN